MRGRRPCRRPAAPDFRTRESTRTRGALTGGTDTSSTVRGDDAWSWRRSSFLQFAYQPVNLTDCGRDSADLQLDVLAQLNDERWKQLDSFQTKRAWCVQERFVTL